MATIPAVPRRIKLDLQVFLPDAMGLEACRRVGHSWRRRQFDPVLTLHLFILQGLHFNTALTHPRYLSNLPMTAAPFCKARIRLPLPAMQMLLRQSAAAMRSVSGANGSWRGLRTWLVDGSSTIAPDTPALDKAFGHSANQREGCSFPVPKLLGLFDAFGGLVIEILCLPLVVHEQAHVWKLYPLLG